MKLKFLVSYNKSMKIILVRHGGVDAGILLSFVGAFFLVAISFAVCKTKKI